MIKSVILHTPVANSYLRNNRSTRQKSLRCFPMCSSKGHVNGGFCGQSLRATIVLGVENNDVATSISVPSTIGLDSSIAEPTSSTIMPYSGLQQPVAELTEGGEAKKDLFELNDFIIIMEIRPLLTPRISGKQFINKQEIHNQLRTKHEKSSLEKELFMGEADLVTMDPEKKELKLFVVFNPNHSSWDYSWKSNRWSGPNEQHVVDIIVLKYYSTTDFQVYSHYVSNPFIVVSSHKKGLPGMVGSLKGSFNKSKSQADFMYTVEAGEHNNDDNEGEEDQNDEKEVDPENRAPSGHEDPYDKPIALPSSAHQAKKRKLKEITANSSTLITLPSSTSTTAIPIHHQIILPNGVIEREKRMNMRNVKQTLILDPNFEVSKPLKARKVTINSDKDQQQVILPKKFPSEPNLTEIIKPKQTNNSKGHSHDDMNDVFEASQLLSNLSAKPYIPMVIDLPKKNLQPLESIPLSSLSVLPMAGEGFVDKHYSTVANLDSVKESSNNDSKDDELNEQVIFSPRSKDFPSGSSEQLEKTLMDDVAGNSNPGVVLLSINGKNQSNIVGSIGSNSGYDSAGSNIDSSFTKFKDSLAHIKHMRKLRRTQYKNHPQLPVKEPGVSPGGPLTTSSAGDSEDDIENSAHQLLLLSTKSTTIANNNSSSSDLPLYDHLQHLAHHPFQGDSDLNKKIVLKSKSSDTNDNVISSRTTVSLYNNPANESEIPGGQLLTIHPMLSVATAAQKPFKTASSSSSIPKQLPHYRQICLPSAGQTYEEELAKSKRKEAAARAMEEANAADFNVNPLFLPLKTTPMTHEVVRIAGPITTTMGKTMRQPPAEDAKLILPKKNVNG
jgi:hypothetical protein